MFRRIIGGFLAVGMLCMCACASTAVPIENSYIGGEYEDIHVTTEQYQDTKIAFQAVVEGINKEFGMNMTITGAMEEAFIKEAIAEGLTPAAFGERLRADIPEIKRNLYGE